MDKKVSFKYQFFSLSLHQVSTVEFPNSPSKDYVEDGNSGEVEYVSGVDDTEAEGTIFVQWPPYNTDLLGVHISRKPSLCFNPGAYVIILLVKFHFDGSLRVQCSFFYYKLKMFDSWGYYQEQKEEKYACLRGHPKTLKPLTGNFRLHPFMYYI